MSRILLTVARLDECEALIRAALARGWSVLNTVLAADIPAILARTKVDLIVLSQRCCGGDWARASSEIWAADQGTPIILCDARLDMESLGQFFGTEHAADPTRRISQLSLSPSLSLIEPEREPRNVGIERALALIDTHYAEPLSLDSVAAAACYSRCHFSKVFKIQIGISFTAYLSLVRIRHAAELLEETGQSITDIAMHVGFKDLSTFERVFRQAHRLSPSQFRSKSRKQDKSQFLRSAAQDIPSPSLAFVK